MPRAERERREAFVQEVEAAFDQAEAAPPPPHLQPAPPPRLVVVGVERCPRCATDHTTYGYRSRP
jgi:hypothetical protein